MAVRLNATTPICCFVITDHFNDRLFRRAKQRGYIQPNANTPACMNYVERILSIPYEIQPSRQQAGYFLYYRQAFPVPQVVIDHTRQPPQFVTII